MASGIKDKVAILGMGCTRFGERWEAGTEELMLEAFEEAIQDAGIERREIQAAWLGTCMEEISVGKSALPLSLALRLPEIPVSRVENYCVTGTEAFRGACYAVASGAYDVAMALGVEKLKDIGYGGLPNWGAGIGAWTWQWLPNITAPGAFAQVATAYAAKNGIAIDDLRRAMAHISVKSHANATLNPKAHLRKAISVDQVLAAPIVAYPLGLFDCCGVSDGAACAIVTTPEIARGVGKKEPVTVKAMQLALSGGDEMGYNAWEVDHLPTTAKASAMAYREAGITDPRSEISLMEVHDCFSITELVTMEDLHISPVGGAVKDVLDGFFALDGSLPCQPDGGLKCFGHPIGASGLRMLYEIYLQLLGRAGKRQVPEPRYGLTHNLGGMPHMSIAGVTILGRNA